MKSNCLLLLIVFLCIGIGCQRTSIVDPVGCTPFAQRVTVVSSAYTKDSAWLQLPCDYYKSAAASDSYPLLIFMNGTGETSNHGNLDTMKILGPPHFINDSIRYEFLNSNVLYDYIVICPQSKTGYRSPSSTNSVINYMIANYRVDPSRIYLTGLSSGAQSVFNYITDKPEYASRIAAAVPMSSLILDSTHRAHLKYISDAKVGIQSYCGLGDYLYAYNKRYVDTINKYAPGLAALTGYSGAHCCWNGPYSPTHRNYNPNMYEWLLNYSK